MRAVAALLGLALLATPAIAARISLGTFESWGAFRDDQPQRCYAIAEPVRKSSNQNWRAFASVSHWPGQGVRGQIHIRMSRERATEATATLRVGERRFALASGGADAWATDARADAAIVAAMRSAQDMAVESRDSQGRSFRDTYRLRGAATAIDAAALGCARR
ncbi:invasion associated locus B family protein [Sphingomonas cavernae]|uniref:Mlr4354 like protein n=1 Tax=Sphingomonas cavernae TaxID=2320861 RepID=A0A418WQZ0_9SPHN|nr:invasion associated locus B family protein [Sphingomonas cavernae]RJF93680.1 hypothetical protein D3876_05095 [Sphingomonas cavernae]